MLQWIASASKLSLSRFPLRQLTNTVPLICYLSVLNGAVINSYDKGICTICRDINVEALFKVALKQCWVYFKEKVLEIISEIVLKLN